MSKNFEKTQNTKGITIVIPKYAPSTPPKNYMKKKAISIFGCIKYSYGFKCPELIRARISTKGDIYVVPYPITEIGSRDFHLSHHSSGDFHWTDDGNHIQPIYREKDFPAASSLLYRQAVLALSEKETEQANRYIEKYISDLSINGISEATISSNLGAIYAEAGILDKAEVYYRKALTLQYNADRLGTLAYFLIDNDRNISEGLELIDEALKLSPGDCRYLHTKGWGLYKQGKHQEAVDILRQSWSLRMKNAVYSYTAWLHLEAAKKAVAG